MGLGDVEGDDLVGRHRASITVPTLLLTGSESTDDLKAATRAAQAAIPGARLVVLEGHGRLAIRADPEMVASIVLDFLGS